MSKHNESDFSNSEEVKLPFEKVQKNSDKEESKHAAAMYQAQNDSMQFLNKKQRNSGQVMKIDPLLRQLKQNSSAQGREGRRGSIVSIRSIGKNSIQSAAFKNSSKASMKNSSINSRRNRLNYMEQGYATYLKQSHGIFVTRCQHMNKEFD